MTASTCYIPSSVTQTLVSYNLIPNHVDAYATSDEQPSTNNHTHAPPLLVSTKMITAVIVRATELDPNVLRENRWTAHVLDFKVKASSSQVSPAQTTVEYDSNNEYDFSEHKTATPPEDDDDTPADYPRPAAPGQQAPNEEHHHYEEEQAKRDHKHGQGGAEHERRVQENLHKRTEQNRPSKEPFSKAPVGRVNQPARQLNV